MNYQIDPEACNQDFTCLSIYVKIARDYRITQDSERSIAYNGGNLKLIDTVIFDIGNVLVGFSGSTWEKFLQSHGAQKEDFEKNLDTAIATLKSLEAQA